MGVCLCAPSNIPPSPSSPPPYTPSHRTIACRAPRGTQAQHSTPLPLRARAATRDRHPVMWTGMTATKMLMLMVKVKVAVCRCLRPCHCPVEEAGAHTSMMFSTTLQTSGLCSRMHCHVLFVSIAVFFPVVLLLAVFTGCPELLPSATPFFQLVPSPLCGCVPVCLCVCI